MRKYGFAALLPAAALIAAGLLGSGIARGQGESPSPVAVIDVTGAFDQLEEKKDLESRLDQDLAEFRNEAQAREQELNQARSRLQFLEEDSPAHREKVAELDEMVFSYQLWRRKTEARLNRRRLRVLENLYEKIASAVGEVCRREGCEVALFKEQDLDFGGQKQEQFAALVQMRKVVWSSDRVDLTDTVVQLMNNRYRMQQRN
jgi:Skp family chaperone for outer membrane proteins